MKKETKKYVENLKDQVIKAKDRNNELIEKCNELVDSEKVKNEKLKRMESEHKETQVASRNANSVNERLTKKIDLEQ